MKKIVNSKTSSRIQGEIAHIVHISDKLNHIWNNGKWIGCCSLFISIDWWNIKMLLLIALMFCSQYSVRYPMSNPSDKLNTVDVISSTVNHPINKSSSLFLFQSYSVSHAHTHTQRFNGYIKYIRVEWYLKWVTYHIYQNKLLSQQVHFPNIWQI